MRFIPHVPCCFLCLPYRHSAEQQSLPLVNRAPHGRETTRLVDYSALRERLATQNKTLQDQVNIQRATVKKNQGSAEGCAETGCIEQEVSGRKEAA